MSIYKNKIIARNKVLLTALVFKTSIDKHIFNFFISAEFVSSNKLESFNFTFRNLFFSKMVFISDNKMKNPK